MGGDWRGNEVAGGWPPSFILGIALCVSLVNAYFVYQHVEVRQVGKRLKKAPATRNEAWERAGENGTDEIFRKR